VSPSPESTPTGAGAASSATPLASPRPLHAAIPTPSLKPGEVITWIRIERPRLELGQILVGSLVLVGLTMALAVFFGILLGHLRSKSTRSTHGAGGLDLR
jgi:hypothetical protein